MAGTAWPSRTSHALGRFYSPEAVDLEVQRLKGRYQPDSLARGKYQEGEEVIVIDEITGRKIWWNGKEW
jgi:hypothetical protein